jgi:hypothetical protein
MPTAIVFLPEMRIGHSFGTGLSCLRSAHRTISSKIKMSSSCWTFPSSSNVPAPAPA